MGSVTKDNSFPIRKTLKKKFLNVVCVRVCARARERFQVTQHICVHIIIKETHK